MSGSLNITPNYIVLGDAVTLDYTWYNDGDPEPYYIKIEAHPNSPGETLNVIYPATPAHNNPSSSSPYTYTPTTWGRIEGGGYKRTSYIVTPLDSNQNSLGNTYVAGLTLVVMPTISVVVSPTSSIVTSEGQVVTFTWTATGNFDKIKYDYDLYNGNPHSSTLYTLYGAQQGQTRTGTITQTQGPGQPLQGYTGQKDFVFIAEHGFNSPYYVPNYINSRLNASVTATVYLAVPWYEVSTNKTNYSEGEIINGTVTTTSVPTGTTLYWQMTTNSGTYAPEDFTNNPNTYEPFGSGTVSNGSFTFSAQVKNDSISEGMETRRVRLYLDAARTNYVRQSPQFYILPSDQPSYGISAAQSVYNEGDTVYCGVSTSNVAVGTTLYWKITGASINEQDFNPGVLEGQGNISSSGSFTFNRAITNDQLTENTEKFKLQLFTNSQRTALVAESPLYSITDTSPSISYHITPNLLNVTEGQQLEYTVQTTGYTPGTVFYWAMEGVGITGSDFSPTVITGSKTVGSNGAFTVTRMITADQTTEGNELIYFRVMYPTSAVGDIVSTNTQVTILDTSQNPPAQSPTIAYFYGSPETISVGQSSTLHWSVTGLVDTTWIDEGVGSVPNSSNTVVSPTTTTTYTLNASGPGGASSATVTIDTTLPVALMVTGPSTVDWQAASIPIQISASNAPNIILYATYDGVVKPQFEIPNSSGSVTFDPYNYIPDWSSPVDTIQLHFAAGATANQTLVIAVDVDRTPDPITLPASPAAPEEEVTSPPVPVPVTDIDVPVEIKADEPIKVQIDGTTNWNNVREI